MSDSQITDYQKEIFRHMKYTNLNADINHEQAGRFAKLFGRGREYMAFLLLRIMNYYAILVFNNINQYANDESFRKYVTDCIYDHDFLNSINHLSSQLAYKNQSNETDDDADDGNVELRKLQKYFDAHFSRQNESVIYTCTFGYTQFNQIYTNEYHDYLNCSNGFPSPSNNVSVYIDDNFYKFIDEMMSFRCNPSKTFWSENRCKYFHNYIDKLCLVLCKS